MTTLLSSLLAAPLILLAALWYSARLVNTPWQTAPEALVRLLYWTALRFQGLAEALDSGINVYRDVTRCPIAPHCEREREIRENQARDGERFVALRGMV